MSINQYLFAKFTSRSLSELRDKYESLGVPRSLKVFQGLSSSVRPSFASWKQKSLANACVANVTTVEVEDETRV